MATLTWSTVNNRRYLAVWSVIHGRHKDAAIKVIEADGSKEAALRIQINY